MNTGEFVYYVKCMEPQPCKSNMGVVSVESQKCFSIL